MIFMVGLSGCTKKKVATDPNANKLVVWGFEDEDAWKEIAEEFTSKNKGYDIVYKRQILNSEYEIKLLNSILSSEGPDVWEMPNDWIYRHSQKLIPLSEKDSADINLDSFLPIVKQSVFINNKIYALTTNSQPLVILYNEDLIEKRTDEIIDSLGQEDARDSARSLLNNFPLTWDEFTEYTKLLTKKNGANIEISGVALGTDKVTFSNDILYLLMYQNGTDIVSDNFELATFNLAKETPKVTTEFPGRRALEFYTSFSNPKSPNYTWNDSLGNNIDAFANGKVATIFAYADTENYLKQKYPAFSYNKAAVPQLYSDDPAKITDYAKFYAYGVSNQTDKPELAWALVKMISGESSSATLNSSMGYSSSQAIKDQEPALTERDQSNPESIELLTSRTLIKGRYPVDFDNAIKNAITEVNRGVQDSGSALNAAANTITQLLTKNTW